MPARSGREREEAGRDRVRLLHRQPVFRVSEVVNLARAESLRQVLVEVFVAVVPENRRIAQGISREEWQRRPDGFDRLDANHDGQLTPDELRAALGARRR